MIDKLSYIAGFIDGEGCITINKNNYHLKKNGKTPEYIPTIIIINTNKEVITWINAFFENKGFVYQIKGQGKRKDWYRLVFVRKQALQITKLLVDYLIIKREQCKKIIDLVDNICIIPNGKNNRINQEEIERREKLFQEVRQLNMRGKNGTDKL